MPEATTISVVICAYSDDRWDDLQRAVVSVQHQTTRAELVVVIDHNEKLAQRARASFENTLVVANTYPAGLSGARNTGIEASHGTIVAFLDDDAVAEPNWLERLLAIHADCNVIAAGGAVTPIWDAGRPVWFPPEFDWVVGCSYTGMPAYTSPIRNPIGCNMSFRREAFDEVGGFRSGVGRVGSNTVGCEETELCIRLQQRWPDCAIVYEPSAAVGHRVPANRGTWRYFRSRCYAEGLSKALVSTLVGANDGLSSERAYTTRVLPLGVARGLAGGLSGRDRAGLAHAAAIVFGLVITTAGYAAGRWRLRNAVHPSAIFPTTTPSGAASSTVQNVSPSESPDPIHDVTNPASFPPTKLVEIELTNPLSTISAISPSGQTYGRAIGLVRLHGEVLGTVEIPLTDGQAPPDDLADIIQTNLHDAIADHLRRDGFSSAPPLDGAGLQLAGASRCEHEREALLESAPFISVVIPTRNRADELRICLDSLRNLAYPHFEVVVVDNALSDDETRRLVSEVSAQDERFRYVRENLPGISRAKNRGLFEARGEVVAFTDDDVIADRHWLTELARGFSVSPRVACVTGLIFPRELETAPQTWIEEFGGFGKGFRQRVFDMDENRPDSPLYPYAAGVFGSGANMAFRADVLRRLGGFDPALGSGSPAMGGEDLAVTFAAVTEGYQIVYEPSAVVHHLHHREYDRLRRQVYGYGVGLTAYVTQTVFSNPGSLARLSWRLPLGLLYAFNPGSQKNARKRTEYPRELTLLEVRGMLYGPLAYLRSRRRNGNGRHAA